MTTEKRNLLFLDNALELPLIKKTRVLGLFPVEFDIYSNFWDVQDKIKSVLTAYEFEHLQKSARQNLDQIIEGSKTTSSTYTSTALRDSFTLLISSASEFTLIV